MHERRTRRGGEGEEAGWRIVSKEMGAKEMGSTEMEEGSGAWRRVRKGWRQRLRKKRERKEKELGRSKFWKEDRETRRDETCVHQCVISLNVMYNHNLSFGTS